MRLLDDEWIFSPSDLTGFAACEHLTQLERRAALGEVERPDRDDPLLEVLSARGGEHESLMLKEHPLASGDVVDIDCDSSSRDGLETAAKDTIVAMQEGVDLIYQATFLHDGWVGHADFVERCDVPSSLGSWSYEVADAKLARTVKPGAILQLCSYSEHVARIQGTTPQSIHVITGDGERHTYSLADHAAYYRALKRRFLEAVAHEVTGTYPDPVEHCSICRWYAPCMSKRRADDHLSLVAGMRRDQTRKLVAAEVPTVHALADSNMPADTLGIGANTLDRLREQAALQVEGAGCSPPLYRLLAPISGDGDEPPQGLAVLPEPSPGDLFLDLEGDPYALDGGLEYLFGIVELVGGKPVYHAFWAYNRAEEKRAFEQVIDLIAERRSRYPDLHVYHYAAYEPSTMGRLIGRHGTREAEVDELFRGKVFVDLYRIVVKSVRLSTESYSLKDVEGLYTTRAGDPVSDAGASIVWYERYLVERDEQLLRDLEQYNEADCASLVALQRWLEEKRVEAEGQFGPIPRVAPEPAEAREELRDLELEITELAERLTANMPDDPAERSAEQQARWMLAQLLWWHRREDKPAWWRFFDRVERATIEELDRDSECIGGLVHEREIGPRQRSVVHRYRFEPQDHKFSVGDGAVDPATGEGAGTIVDIGDDFVELKRGPSLATVRHPQALVPGQPFDNRVLREAIHSVGEWVADNGVDAPGRYRAARDLLLRVTPRVDGVDAGSELIEPDEGVLAAACRLVGDLETSYLPIQGPPGAGKTYTGARMICTLLDAGCRVGVTAFTHSAITNLLQNVCDAADESGIDFRGVQRTDQGKQCVDDRIKCAEDNGPVDAALTTGQVELIGGTPWLWARPQMQESVDVLFVDEAGQMSLANVVAISGAAQSLVLLGDPQQLAQPSHGSHPDGAEASALQHVLGDRETVPPARGLFLDATYRMHPNVSEFISEIAYEGRLRAAAGRELQEVNGFAGLRFVPVEHAGNRVRSPEEADAVRVLIEQLVGLEWTDHDGVSRKLTTDDIIVVAPYNAHVAELRRLLPGSRIGTVDKFQGRQGVVAIYSMASSSVDESPRGMNFLYDLHRLNVAVSRARAIGIVVCSPELLRVLAHSPEQTRLANALCRYVEVARDAR
jgi:predicted RecB family nuclease